MSKLNSMRHGLSVPNRDDAKIRLELHRLTRRIAGRGADECRLYHAQKAAEAELELRRVQSAQKLLLRSTKKSAYDFITSSSIEPHPFEAIALELLRLNRYEARAFAKKLRALAML